MTPPNRGPSLAFDATIGLGSNIGDKAANIDAAITQLTARGDVQLIAASRKYRSAPWGVQDQDWFVNACISVATALSAHALLELCQAVESEMGRIRRQKWGPRLIDVDILTYRDALIREPDLIVPHPLITKRGFVLVPLHEVAPDLKIGGRILAEWIAKIDVADVVPFDERQ